MARSRQEAEFTEFVQSRWQSLHRTAYLLVGDHGSAEDLVRRTLAKAYVAWGRIRATHAADAYVRRVMVMTAISWWRGTSWRAGRERPADDVPGKGVTATDDAITRRQWICSEVARLPRRQRAIVVLRFHEGLSDKQIAHVLESSTATVTSQAHIAMRTLGATLGRRDRAGADGGGSVSDALEDALPYQAEHADVPPLDVDDVLAYGRSRQQTRRTATIVAGVAGAVVVAVAALPGWLGGDDTGSTAEVDDSATMPPSGDSSLALYTRIGPYVTGRTLHVGDATVTLDPGLSGLYPTRIGAVVKLDAEGSDEAHADPGDATGEPEGEGDGASTGPAEDEDEGTASSRVVFVGTDGETRELGSTGFDTVIGTDPATTLVAFSQPTSRPRGSYDVVVVDARDGSEVARTTLDVRPWAGWDTPAVSLAGDAVYVQGRRGWLSWEFRAGDEVHPLGTKPGSEVAGGVLATGSLDRPVRFVRLSDGEVLSTYDAGHEEEWIELSHDGSHGIIYDVMAMPDWSVIDTATATVTPLPPTDSSLRAVTWAPSGDLVLWSGVEEDSDVRACDPATGQCDEVDGVVLDDIELWGSGQTAER